MLYVLDGPIIYVYLSPPVPARSTRARYGQGMDVRERDHLAADGRKTVRRVDTFTALPT